LADAVNNLLAVGFYLINVGYVALAQVRGEAHRPGRGDRDPQHEGRPRPARPGRDAFLQPLRVLEGPPQGAAAEPETPGPARAVRRARPGLEPRTVGSRQ